MDRRISSVLLILALLITLLTGGSQAQGGGLGLGALEISYLGAGYRGYALPVANWSLARQWAEGSGLDWQAAYNSSIIPVRMDLTHRQARALTGRLEVVTRDGYTREEDPLRHEAVTTREFLVPPSVPTSVVLTPRVCPAAEAGGILELTVRLYLGDSTQPQFEQRLEVMQLEPAHLYALHLDGAPGIDIDVINPGNHLELEPPLRNPEQPLFPPEMLSSAFYTISCLPGQVTLAPLAARDFAFVFADAARVREWPEEEQAGLAQFVVGGGHLCLYNAAGAWQGLSLDNGPGQTGRGVLLPVAGGFPAARGEVVTWLEGELTEFVLWCGGRAGGWATPNLVALDGLAARVPGIQQANTPWLRGDGPVARRAGYLHPVWIYRETCRQAALEPWDFPEFTSVKRDIILNNRNLAPLNDRDNPPGLRPFALCVTESRGWPAHLGWLFLVLPLAFLSGGVSRRHWWPGLVLAAAALGLGLSWWLATGPVPVPSLGAVLVDAAEGCDAATARLVQAAQPSHRGSIRLEVPDGSQVRRTGGNPVDWRLTGDNHGASWSCTDARSNLVLVVDTPREAVEPPVRVTGRHREGRRLRLVLDTRGVPADRECYLVHPLGSQVVPGGRERVAVEIEVPRIPVRPGRERLAVLEDWLAPRLTADLGNLSRIGVSQPDLLRYLARFPGGDAAAGAVDRLCWLGLCQNPLGLRGVAGGQGVVFAPLPGEAASAERGYLRFTFPLEVPR